MLLIGCLPYLLTLVQVSLVSMCAMLVHAGVGLGVVGVHTTQSLKGLSETSYTAPFMLSYAWGAA